MKRYMKSFRADYLLSSLLCVLLGVVLIVWRQQTIDVIGTVLALICIVTGTAYLCGFFIGHMQNILSAIMGGIVILIGVWILLQPSFVLILIPIVIGVLLLTHGIRGIVESVSLKRFGYGSWAVGVVFSIISIALGVVCIFNAFGVLELAFVIIGISLIYNGLSNLYIGICAGHWDRKYQKQQDIIDVEFKESDTDETDGI